MKNITLLLSMSVNESGYISINKAFPESDFKEQYDNYIESTKSVIGITESEEGYRLGLLSLEISYDGRKRKVTELDAFKALAKNGYALHVTSDFFKPSEKLSKMMEENLSKRKEMLGIN